MAAHYDVVVIGAGPGGYVAAIRAAQLGLKTACIDKRKTLGGTCLNVGCIPSKALLHSSEYFAWFHKNAEEHGIQGKGLSVDFSKMMNRKDKLVATLVDGIAGLFKKNHVAWIQGMARLTGSDKLEVLNELGTVVTTIHATHIILATGSEPTPLPFLPFDEKVILSSTGALSLPAIPKQLLVVGAGVIGVELASVYQRLGTKVTIVEMLDKICPAMDAAVSKALLQILKKQGIDFRLGVKVTKGEVEKGIANLSIEENKQEISLSADAILVAVGRRPFTDGLGLREAGITLSPKGFVEVDDCFRTSISSIYAIGDMIDGVMLAHRASEEGIAVAELIAGLHPHVNYLTIPNVIYTHPEVAAVGLTEQEASAMGLSVKTGICSFRAIARARCSGDVDGFVKVIGETRSGRLIGMHIIGSHASEMIGEGVIAIEKKATLEDIAQAPHAHPTLSEAVKEAALNALGRAIHF